MTGKNLAQTVLGSVAHKRYSTYLADRIGDLHGCGREECMGGGRGVMAIIFRLC